MEVVKRYFDRGSWGYVRVRLFDGRILLEHRYVMEKALGRPLKSDEYVHHRDGNKHNNDPSNLALTTRRAHGLKHAKYAEEIEFQCPVCNKKFTRSKRYVRTKLKNGQKLFYCGRKCRMPKDLGGVV